MAYNAKEVGAAVRVASASIHEEIRETHPTTVQMLADRGVRLGRDRSQPLTDEMIAGSDLVLVMTSDHARAVVGRFPKSRTKVFLLEHLAAEVQPAAESDTVDTWLATTHTMRRDYARSQHWDIQDPISESDAVYKAVEVQIDNATMWLATVISTLSPS